MKFSYGIAMCDPAHYLPLAQATEAAGYDYISVPDSLCYPQEASSKYPYNDDGSREFLESLPFVESLVAVTAMAAVTVMFSPHREINGTVLDHRLHARAAERSLLVAQGVYFE